MNREEIIYNIEHLEQRLIKIDNYFNTLTEEELVSIEDTREYVLMKKIILRLNALYSALENCV